MKIREIELLTDHLEETARFYAAILGFAQIGASSDRISFQVGESVLTFKRSVSTKPIYHFAFTIPSNKIEEALAWVAGITTVIGNADGELITEFENWKARAVYFYDNNENILELIARADLNNPSEETFGTPSILSISEMGLVADEPLELAAQLCNDKQLDYFSKGPKRNDFVAVGTDEGLFVISNPDRNWYPTQKRAEKFPTIIEIEFHDTVRKMSFHS
jgi:catechol 2,3-dioxygenase-like lactoylglutathione lyase family enzyme